MPTTMWLICIGILIAVVCAEPSVERVWTPDGYVLTASARDQTAQCVNDYLCIGNQNAACNEHDLRDKGITRVISLIGDLECAPPGIARTIISVDDVPGQDMREAFSLAHSVIEQERKSAGRVMVHCAAGVSRASSTVIYHLMHAQGIGYDHALTLVRMARSVVRPNSGFEKQLRAIEKERAFRDEL